MPKQFCVHHCSTFDPFASHFFFILHVLFVDMYRLNVVTLKNVHNFVLRDKRVTLRQIVIVYNVLPNWT